MMLRRTLLAACSLALLASCAKLPSKATGLGGACTANNDCADPYVCVNAVCSFPAYKSCTPNVKACVGEFVGTCKADGSAYDLEATACATGCFQGACRAQSCTPNTEKQCVGDIIRQCNANGSGFETFQVCPAGCETTATGVECKAPVCNPYETRCKAGDSTNTKVETCNSLGTAYVESTCPASPESTCFQGRCVAKVCSVQRDGAGAITARQQRCNGVVREACSDDGSAYQPVEVCSTVCLENDVAQTTSCAVRNCLTSTGQVADPFQTECDDTQADTLKRCDARGLEWVAVDCTTEIGADATCVRGRCLPRVCANATPTSREQRCSGNIREQCNLTETGFEAVPASPSAPNPCPFGCVENAGTAACRAAECTLGQEKCDGDAIYRCNSEGTFTFVQLCASGCNLSGSGATADASCRNAICNPLTRRCGLDSTNANAPISYVEQCRADGTGHDRIETCSSICASGVCTITPATCVPGNLRCRGRETELCVRLPNGDTEWRFTGYCLGACIDGTCDDVGACSCSGSNTPPAAACGSTTRQPITLKVLLPPDEPTATVPCDDGKSKVLVYSEPIADQNGRPVPDGTLVTFAVATNSPSDTAALPAFASADADPSTPGIQRPTLHGRARVLIGSPAQLACPTTANVPRPLKVTATLDGRCAGSTNVPFQNRVTGTPRFTYLSEDFSTAAIVSRQQTTAMWDTTTGRASAFAAFDLGTGADGDLTVPAGTTAVDFNANYGTVFEVRAIQAQSITVDRFPTVSAGDEILVVTQSSPASDHNGIFEFRRVVSYASNSIVFDRPFTRNFAPNPTDLSGLRVIAQKVPNFNNVTIDATSTAAGELRVYGPNGGSGSLSGPSGILAFRARGTLLVKGRITAAGAGFASNVTSLLNFAPTSAPYIDRLVLGHSSNGTRASGVVYITASALTFAEGGPTAPYIEAVGAAGSAGAYNWGTIYLGVGTYRAIANQANFIRAVGSRVRFDYSSAPNAVDAADLANDNSNNTVSSITNLSLFSGQAGPYLATSNLAYESPAGGSLVRIRLLGGIFSRGTTSVVGAASALGGFAASGIISNTITPTETSVDLTQGTSVSGLPTSQTRFRWQTAIAPETDELYGISGLSFRVCDENCN